MKGPKTLFCPSKFPWERERITSKFIDNLARALKNVLGCQAVLQLWLRTGLK